MVTTATVPMPDDRPNTYGWLQIEKRTAGELQKLAIKYPVAMGTLMLMVNRMSRTNALLISQQAIADELGVTRRSINAAIGILESSHFIEIERVAGAPVYRVNTRVAWQGKRGARFAHFCADVFAIESEQTRNLDEKQPALKTVPVLQEGERYLVGNEEQDPPDQQELHLP